MGGEPASRRWLPPIGFALGLAVFATMLAAPAPPTLGEPGWRVAAAALLMAIWWLSEALPVPVTALLPLILFPALGVRSAGETAAAFGDPLIFLFLGGFLIALAIERWGLHERIARMALSATRGRPAMVVLGFLATSAFISLWVSNTATVAMLMPVGLSTLAAMATGRDGPVERADRNLRTATMLAIAYGATIGGVGTLVGTPPNALFAAYAHETLGRTIGFVEWMAVGLPVALALLPAAWVWLALIAFPVHGAHRGVVTARQNRPLAPLGHPAIMVAAVFTLTALLWVTRPLYQNVIPGWRIGDTEIALFGALLLFLLPSGRLGSPPLLDWSAAKSLPWGTLILFGGGLALAGAIETSRLAAWLGRGFATLEGVSPLVLVLAVSAVIVALSELASNTAVAAIFLPIIGAAAIGLGSDPVGLAAPAILASSLAFMMPVGTPPNAIIYGTGHVTIGQMARAGLVLNLLGVAAIVLIGYPIARLVLAE